MRSSDRISIYIYSFVILAFIIWSGDYAKSWAHQIEINNAKYTAANKLDSTRRCYRISLSCCLPPMIIKVIKKKPIRAKNMGNPINTERGKISQYIWYVYFINLQMRCFSSMKSALFIILYLSSLLFVSSWKSPCKLLSANARVYILF